MPIILRKVFGPFKPEEFEIDRKWVSASASYEFIPGMRWHFFGIRDDHTQACWSLSYNSKTRKFAASNIPLTGMTGKVGREVAASLPGGGTKILHPKMFIGDREPVLSGATITIILKSRLSEADIAKATALTILRK
ncbi:MULTISPECIES: hypothetical protein [Agrobacterium]|uniref:hypothetical protein n=1 Tax=Agrobacterium TaxID=357 RepID=UPI00230006F5|nr:MULTISPECIES: hypothetical protein [Agrobacterium]MDA5627806.1 hypothetical protein [Agrobacterium sp. ST15.16.055]MDA6978447.1 hypothetical protein [Agrobacterium salinitolerans]